jgi:hypothetical protein
MVSKNTDLHTFMSSKESVTKRKKEIGRHSLGRDFIRGCLLRVQRKVCPKLKNLWRNLNLRYLLIVENIKKSVGFKNKDRMDKMYDVEDRHHNLQSQYCPKNAEHWATTSRSNEASLFIWMQHGLTKSNSPNKTWQDSNYTSSLKLPVEKSGREQLCHVESADTTYNAVFVDDHIEF